MFAVFLELWGIFFMILSAIILVVLIISMIIDLLPKSSCHNEEEENIMTDYHDIDNIKNERVKLALHNLDDARGCISSDEMYQDVEVVIAYILCLEEKENNLKEELRKIYKRKGLI